MEIFVKRWCRRDDQKHLETMNGRTISGQHSNHKWHMPKPLEARSTSGAQNVVKKWKKEIPNKMKGNSTYGS
jgi:hypothetical protein